MAPPGVPKPGQERSKAGREPGVFSRQTEPLCDQRQVVDVSIGGPQAHAHRDNRDMGATRLAPAIDLLPDFADPTLGTHHIFSAELFDRPL